MKSDVDNSQIIKLPYCIQVLIFSCYFQVSHVRNILSTIRCLIFMRRFDIITVGWTQTLCTFTSLCFVTSVWHGWYHSDTFPTNLQRGSSESVAVSEYALLSGITTVKWRHDWDSVITSVVCAFHLGVGIQFHSFSNLQSWRSEVWQEHNWKMV